MNCKILILFLILCSNSFGQIDSTPNSPIKEGDIFIFYTNFTNRHFREIYGEESKLEVEKIISLLKANPKLKFELSNHTDHRGSNEFNLKLSKRSSDFFFNYLIRNYEIDKEQVVCVGYGEEKSIVPENIVKSIYNEEARKRAIQVNRRFELKVLSKLTKQ